MSLYHPLHEASEEKAVEVINNYIKKQPQTSKLKELRIDYGITQVELSNRSGVSLRAIQMYEQLNKDIRNYIDTDEYDKIIKCAVKNHNKYKIENDLNEKEELFCKIVRDADKLDILYEILEIFWKEDKDKPNVEYSKIPDEVMEQILNREPVRRKKGDDDLVKLLCTVAFVFDINFDTSLTIIEQENYINRILNSFEFKDENTKKQIELIKENVNNYIDERLKK